MTTESERRGQEILERLEEIRDQLTDRADLMAERNDLFVEGQALRPKLTQREMAARAGISDVTVHFAVQQVKGREQEATSPT